VENVRHMNMMTTWCGDKCPCSTQLTWYSLFTFDWKLNVRTDEHNFAVPHNKYLDLYLCHPRLRALPHILYCCHTKHVNCSFSQKKKQKTKKKNRRRKNKIHTSEKRVKLWFWYTSLAEFLWKPDYASMEVCTRILAKVSPCAGC